MKNFSLGGISGLLFGLAVPPTLAVLLYPNDPEPYRKIYYFITHWFFIYFPICYFLGDFYEKINNLPTKNSKTNKKP